MNKTNLTKMYTPTEVAEVLRVKKNTVYRLISRGEIVAKKIGKLYRIPLSSISFSQIGLDYDLYQADKIDLEKINRVQLALKEARG